MMNFGVVRERDVEYDGRFGYEEHCAKSTWRCDSERVGERWLFRFPNGKEISVVRRTSWRYEYVCEGLSNACSYGFPLGLYEAAQVSNKPGWGECFEDLGGYLTFKEVKELLDKIEKGE